MFLAGLRLGPLAPLCLMPRLPGLVGHPIDAFAGLLLRDGEPALDGRLLIPIGEAIPAETRQIHQIDVLHPSVLAQMRNEPPEGRGLKLSRDSSINFAHGFLVSSPGNSSS